MTEATKEMKPAKQPSSVVVIKPLYLARADAAAFLALSESTLEALVARGDAPKPRKISKGRTAWLVEELENWGRSLPESDLLPPKNSGYGRAGNTALVASGRNA